MLTRCRNPEVKMFVVPLFLLLTVLHHSSAAVAQPSNLLETANPVEVSPNNTFCCNDTTNQCTSAFPFPLCAFDDNNSTRWTLPPGQLNASLTLSLGRPSLIDHFELTLDASSVTRTSIVVALMSTKGNPVTSWVTYLNKTCQPNDTYLRNDDSTYYSCIASGQPWNVSVPDGLFAVRNGSSGWFWWQPFQLLKLTIEIEQSDYLNHNSTFSIVDIRLFGWNQPNQTCNCHPVGVANTSAPCSSNGSCICRSGNGDSSQCIPYVAQVDPSYGALSGGTNAVIAGGFLQNPTNVTIGNYTTSSITPRNDTFFETKTAQCSQADVRNPFPIWICWAFQTSGAKSCIVSGYTFTYLPDPVVQSISPRKSIDRGGIPQTIIGQNLDSVAFPYLIVYAVTGSEILEYNYTTKPFPNLIDSFCRHVNSTMLICLSIPLNGILVTSDTQLSIGVSLDIDKYDGYPQCHIQDGHCDFYLSSVIVNTWTDDPTGYPSYQGQMSLSISGQYFTDVAKTPDDYQVKVGGLTCKIESIVSNVVQFDPPDASLVDTSKPQNTVLYIGAYYNFTVGDLLYYPTWISDPKNRNAVIGGLVGGVGGFILLVAVIVVVVLWCRRQQRKELLYPDSERYIGLRSGHNVSLVDYLPDEFRGSVQKYTVPYNRLQLVRELGKGQFGKVYQGTLLTTNGDKQPVAVKTLHVGNRDVKEKVEFLAEAMLMADFCHKHVLSLIAIAIEKNSPFVILPLMEHGDLKGFISNTNNTFTAGDLVNFSLQVAEGMEYLASKKFVHRDLAARNCMINGDFLVKVADFGLARDIFENDYYRPQDKSRPLPFRWMAIECLSSNTCFTEKSDVWSYGVLLWELMTRGKHPYSHVDNFELKRFLTEGRRLEKPPASPDFMYDIMLRCWVEDAKARPHFKEIVQELKEILSIVDLSNTAPRNSSMNENRDQNVISEARKSYLDLFSSDEHQ